MNAADDRDHDNDDDKAFLGRPEPAKSNRLFAQIGIWQQRISKNKVPETSSCENVLHVMDTPLQELSVGGQRRGLYYKSQENG